MTPDDRPNSDRPELDPAFRARLEAVSVEELTALASLLHRQSQDVAAEIEAIREALVAARAHERMGRPVPPS